MNILLIEINTFIPPAVPISPAYIGALAKAEGFGVKIITIGFVRKHLRELLEKENS